MFRISSALLWVLVRAVVLCVDAPAQANAGDVMTDGREVFASVQKTLNDATDRALANALADRPRVRHVDAGVITDRQSLRLGSRPMTRVRAAAERVKQLRPIIEPILREEGLPTELSAVILVESGGSDAAFSPKGARGLWQLMPETARRYGIVVSAIRDDRSDITLSTRAAARYLRDLYNQFGTWQLALAAYNVGEQAVGRAIGRAGQGDFALIQRSLPKETRNYVPAVFQAMAALELDVGPDSLRLSPHSRAQILFATVEPHD